MQYQSKYKVCSFKNRPEKKNIKKCINCPAFPLLRVFIARASTRPLGTSLPLTSWIELNEYPPTQRNESK